MLDGYDNPQPTPRPPLTGLNFNERFPKGPVRPVKPFSRRISLEIARQEAAGKRARDESFIVIPTSGIWRKVGHRSFYRLFGLHYFQHGSGRNGIQKAIDQANSRVFIKDANYPISANITPKTGIWVEGETSNGTKLQANANNLKLFTVGGVLMTAMRFLHMGVDANGFTGLTGFDLNMSSVEASTNNWVHDIQFFSTVTGAFTSLLDVTGNEDSWLDLVYLQNTAGSGFGDIIAKVKSGQLNLDRILYPQPSGTGAGLRVMGQEIAIVRSVLNTVIIENQMPGDFNTTGQLSLRDTFLANSQPASVDKITMSAATGTQGPVVLTLKVDGCRVGLANTGTFFANRTARTFSINQVTIVASQFVNLDSTAVTWAKNTGGSSLTPGKQLDWSYSNSVSGTIANGDVVSGGYGVFNFQVPPAGWSLTQVPAKPTLTGVANAVRQKFPRPVLIYQVGPVGTHIIDSGPLRDGAGGTDTALGVDPGVVQLNYAEQIYYATTVPSAWAWFGL